MKFKKIIPFIFFLIATIVFTFGKNNRGNSINTALSGLYSTTQHEKIPVLKVREDEISDLLAEWIDSLSILGDSQSYTLTWSENDLSEYSFKSQKSNECLSKPITGVYYTKQGVPVYIIGVTGQELGFLGFDTTADSVDIKHQTTKKHHISMEYSGLNVSIIIPTERDRFTLRGALNGKDISKLSQNTTKPGYRIQKGNSSFKTIRDASFSKNFDTVRVGLRGIGYDVRPIKGTKPIALYQFDDSFNGRVISRMVDSIMANNTFTQLGITKSDNNNIKIAYIYQDIDDIAKIKGCMTNHTTREPIFIFDVNDCDLESLGIVKTDKEVTLQKVTFPFVCIERLGYGAFIERPKDSTLRVWLLYNNVPLFDQYEAKPFEWMFDY